MADLFEKIKAFNTVLTVEKWELKYTMRSADDIKNFGYLDESQRRGQWTKKGAVVGKSNRMYKPSECATAKELLIKFE